MTESAGDLWMTRMRLRIDKLYDFGRRRKMPLRDVDPGYLVHCAMGELFGEHSPKPFLVEESRGRHLSVLAYSSKPEELLREHADSFSDPSVHTICNWDQFNWKAMPMRWPEGKQLGFQVRCCPVVRTSTEHPKHRKGAEVDVFLSRCRAVGDDVSVDRGEVYAEWLKGELERRGGARLIGASLAGFKRERLTRRTQGMQRKHRSSERPDARMMGEIEVTETEAFRRLLGRGIGRHRAFGFGMLLLKPISAS